MVWAVFGIIRPIAVAINPESNPLYGLIIVGALAETTRGYSPIAANLWAIESFPVSARLPTATHGLPPLHAARLPARRCLAS